MLAKGSLRAACGLEEKAKRWPGKLFEKGDTVLRMMACAARREAWTATVAASLASDNFPITFNYADNQCL